MSLDKQPLRIRWSWMPGVGLPTVTIQTLDGRPWMVTADDGSQFTIRVLTAMGNVDIVVNMDGITLQGPNGGFDFRADNWMAWKKAKVLHIPVVFGLMPTDTSEV